MKTGDDDLKRREREMNKSVSFPEFQWGGRERGRHVKAGRHGQEHRASERSLWSVLH